MGNPKKDKYMKIIWFKSPIEFVQLFKLDDTEAGKLIKKVLEREENIKK